jgi:hypothetical protein
MSRKRRHDRLGDSLGFTLSGAKTIVSEVPPWGPVLSTHHHVGHSVLVSRPFNFRIRPLQAFLVPLQLAPRFVPALTMSDDPQAWEDLRRFITSLGMEFVPFCGVCF